MNKKLVFIVGGGAEYAAMYKNEGWNVTHDRNEADLIQFTGGSDVSPFLYGEPKHSKTGNDPRRDEVEQEVYNFAQGAGIPVVGICRGGQFLNVMNGGKMWQHVDGHAVGPHTARALGHLGKVNVTSTHHQMMRPNLEAEYLILMEADEATYKEFMGGNGCVRYHKQDTLDVNYTDVESIYYPQTNTLCFQPHPEFHGPVAQECRRVFFFFLNNYLLANLDLDAAVAQSFKQW